MTTIAKVAQDGEVFGRVFWDEGWAAFGWGTPDVPGNGPFDTAEAAGEALADELDRKVGDAKLLDVMLYRCRRHDAQAT